MKKLEFKKFLKECCSFKTTQMNRKKIAQRKKSNLGPAAPQNPSREHGLDEV
jgi:hypothetical protein